MRGRMLAAVLAVFISPALAAAATGPKVGAKDSWDEMQKFEYQIGQLAGALNMCNNFGLSARLRELSDLSPYGRKGWASLLSFDDIRGGRCGSYAESAKKLLDDRDKLRGYLTEKYHCPGGECAPEGADDSLGAACRSEAEEHLAALPIPEKDIRSVSMVNRTVGATRVTTGREGHEAWVRLDSCSGWLIVELSKSCSPRQSFTRGACTIDGVKGF